MPTIVFASPKGGAGKSTAAILLATELVGHKAAVTVIDADPNKPLSHWASRPGKPELLTVVENVTERTILDTIDKAATQNPFVIVDLEGTASMMVGLAMSRADLVIIPSQGSHLDAAEAAKAIQLVELQEQAFRKKIPYAVLFTRTNPVIRARTLQSVETQFADNKIPMFTAQINEREAFRAIFSFGGTLTTLDPAQVPNITAAKANAVLFASEVVNMLKVVKRTGASTPKAAVAPRTPESVG
jgi:chromosome partitioning protein